MKCAAFGPWSKTSRLPGGPCINQLASFFGRDTFPVPSLLTGVFDAGQEVDLPNDFLKRSVLGKSSHKLNHNLAVTHVQNIPEHWPFGKHEGARCTGL